MYALVFYPLIMLKMGFYLFNVERIHEFTSTFVVIYSSTSYHFGFPSRNKRPHLYTLLLFVTTLINKYNKFAFIRLYEDFSLAGSSSSTRTCHYMKNLVQTTGGDTSYINGKSEISD